MTPIVLQHDTFTNVEGETVNRLVLDVDGHNVQVLQYDDSPRLVVLVDETAAQMCIDEVADFIASRTGGNG